MTASRPLVALLVGTDHHPFDRLVGWAAEIATDDDTEWFVQHGATRLPSGLEGAPLLTAGALHDLLTRADAVVCHGGPGLIMEARAVGHRPVVVARDPALGEHVDDHQQRFLGFLDRRGLVTAVDSLDGLRRTTRAAVAEAGTSRSHATTAANATAARFGALVDDLLHRA